MNQGIQRKTPDRQTCPCCGEFMYHVNEDGSLPHWITENAQAICEQAHSGDGSLIVYALYWQCRTCGCKWKHGDRFV